MTDWAKFGRAVGGNPLPQVADGGYTPVEPGLTIGKLNERNAAAYSQDAAATPAAGAAPELKPVGVYRYGYPEGYPTDPSEGLGSNSVVAIRNSNAAEYGHSDSYNSPTNMVGDGLAKEAYYSAKDDYEKDPTPASKAQVEKYRAMAEKEKAGRAGDAQWRVELVLASGEKRGVTVEAGSGDEAQGKAMKFFPNVNHIVSSKKA